jgi:AhpD family alkylhydroperoxidase
MINSPEMRKRANHLVFYFREESELPQNIQELVMIMTARAKDCQYIWFAHAARARKEGISDAFIDALRDKKPLPKLGGAEQIVVDYVTELFGTNRVSEATFKARLSKKPFSGRFLLLGIWTSSTLQHRSIPGPINRVLRIPLVISGRPERAALLTTRPRPPVLILVVGVAHAEALVLHLTPATVCFRSACVNLDF